MLPIDLENAMVAAEPSSSNRIKKLPWELDWNLLRTFIVIVEERGITAAANRLRLKQPTVSNALKRLEDRLQKRLIDRAMGRFEITAAGLLLYKEAVGIFGSVSRLDVLIRDMKEEITGHVTIALASYVVSPILDEVLKNFHHENPEVTFSIEVMTSSVVTTSVLQKQASIGICLVHKQHDKLKYVRLFREYFGFFCGPSHRLYGLSDLKLQDLRGETSVSFKTDILTDALRPVAILREEAQLNSRIIGMSANAEEVRRMIVAGLGIGALPLHVAQPDVDGKLLWRLPPYDSPPAIDIYVIHNPSTVLNRAEEKFLSALHQRISEVPLCQRDYT